jgi:hypothetical protein
MKQYPSIVASIVIAAHVAFSWCISSYIKSSGNSKPWTVALAISETVVPAMLLVLARRIPLIIRVLIFILSLQAASYHAEQRLFFVFLLFSVLVAVPWLILSLSTGWQISPSRETLPLNSQRKGFSMLQLLGAVTATAVVLAAVRTRFDVFHVIRQGSKDEWLTISLLALFTSTTVAIALTRKYTLILSFFFALAILATAVSLPVTYGSEKWLFATLTLIGVVSAALPAIALRLCGWHWARKQTTPTPTVSPQENESTIAIPSLSQSTNPQSSDGDEPKVSGDRH